MKRISRGILFALALLLLTVCGVQSVLALTTADAKEKIDPEKACSLTLTYAIDREKIKGLDIEIFQAAAVSEDFIYTMTGAFADYPVEINGIRTQNEWDEVRDTVGAYIAADHIAPLQKQTTDENGAVAFEKLPVGLYYVRWTGNETVDQVRGFAPFMIAVPTLGEDGKWIYDVDALPKPGILPGPDAEKLTLVKLWRDGSREEKRPATVSVDIIRNGELFESVTLSRQNNWTYAWETDGRYTWTAVERNIPSNYTVSVTSTDGNTIQITNTLTHDPVPPPDTGEASGAVPWIVLTALLGLVLIVLSTRIGTGKKDNEA